MEKMCDDRSIECFWALLRVFDDGICVCVCVYAFFCGLRAVWHVGGLRRGPIHFYIVKYKYIHYRADTTVQFPRGGHCVEAHGKCSLPLPIEFTENPLRQMTKQLPDC